MFSKRSNLEDGKTEQTSGSAVLFPVGFTGASIFSTTKILQLTKQIKRFTAIIAGKKATIQSLRQQIQNDREQTVFTFGAGAISYYFNCLNYGALKTLLNGIDKRLKITELAIKDLRVDFTQQQQEEDQNRLSLCVSIEFEHDDNNTITFNILNIVERVKHIRFSNIQITRFKLNILVDITIDDTTLANELTYISSLKLMDLETNSSILTLLDATLKQQIQAALDDAKKRGEQNCTTFNSFISDILRKAVELKAQQTAAAAAQAKVDERARTERLREQRLAEQRQRRETAVQLQEQKKLHEAELKSKNDAEKARALSILANIERGEAERAAERVAAKQIADAQIAADAKNMEANRQLEFFINKNLPSALNQKSKDEDDDYDEFTSAEAAPEEDGTTEEKAPDEDGTTEEKD